MKRVLQFVSFSVLGINAFAQAPFSQELTPEFQNTTIKLDCRLFTESYQDSKDYVDVFAVSADSQAYDPITKKFAPIKGNISGVVGLRDLKLTGAKADSAAIVLATIDKNQKDLVLGDGGGVIMFNIRRDAKTHEWKIKKETVDGKSVSYLNMDFRNVGGTIGNKGFTYLGPAKTNTRRLLVTEGIENISSNKGLTGFADTLDYTYPDTVTTASQARSVIPAGKKVKKYQIFGWPVEIDAVTGKVIGKVHRMGRGVTAIANDGNSLYLVFGGNPSVLMQFTPTVINQNKMAFPDEDPRVGGDGGVLLRAFKQNADGTGGFTIPIAMKADTVADPDDPSQKAYKYSQIFDSLLVAKDVALRAGATMFANIGDIAVTTDENNYKVLVVTEKGIDDSGDMYSSYAKKYNGKLALHLQNLDTLKKAVKDQRFLDPFGRVLGIMSEENAYRISVLTEGGATRSGGYFFSNPDKIESINTDPVNGSTTLFTIKENIPATSQGRNPGSTPISDKVNESYYFESGSPAGGALNYDYSSVDLVLAPVPFSEYKLYQSSSKGSVVTSKGGYLTDGVGTFLANSKTPNQKDFDTYLTVETGYAGTDKSRILAVRNIYPTATKCLDRIITGMEENERLEDNGAFSIWPNPSSGVLHVKETANYVLTDLAGQNVRTFQSTDVLDLTGLIKGIYFVKKESGEVKKVIFE